MKLTCLYVQAQGCVRMHKCVSAYVGVCAHLLVVCMLGAVKVGTTRSMSQAILISCVTLGKLLTFSELKFPEQ